MLCFGPIRWWPGPQDAFVEAREDVVGNVFQGFRSGAHDEVEVGQDFGDEFVEGSIVDGVVEVGVFEAAVEVVAQVFAASPVKCSEMTSSTCRAM